MSYYVHIGQDTVINSCPKSTDHRCAVGPFETLEDAQKWVESHERRCASLNSHGFATKIDIRRSPK